jgi:hypothetical protein
MRRIGRKRYRLNGLIRGLAQERRVGYTRAWLEFKTSFRRAFHVDLDDAMDRFERERKIRTNMPAYLEATGQLDNALMVAEALAKR